MVKGGHEKAKDHDMELQPGHKQQELQKRETPNITTIFSSSEPLASTRTSRVFVHIADTISRRPIPHLHNRGRSELCTCSLATLAARIPRRQSDVRLHNVFADVLHCVASLLRTRGSRKDEQLRAALVRATA